MNLLMKVDNMISKIGKPDSDVSKAALDSLKEARDPYN